MDIHLLPSAVMAAAGRSTKQVGQNQEPEGTFHQALSRAAVSNSPCQKSSTSEFAGESACATSMDQQFAAPGGPGFSLPGLSTRASKPDQVSEAAKQFEALIIGQVLKAARESSDKGWLGTGDDPTSSMAMEMAEQGLAQGLAAQGGLGIAKMVTTKLRRGETKAASSGPTSPSPQIQPSKNSVHQALTQKP